MQLELKSSMLDSSKRTNDPRSTEVLIRLALTEVDEDKAWEPVTVLHFRATREVLSAAQQLCSGAIAKERELGANILGQLGVPQRVFPNECFDRLAGMLAVEADPGVLNAIAVAFGHLHDPRCIDMLIPLKSHPDEEVRYGVVHGLLGHDDPKAINALIELSRDFKDDVRDWSTFGLGTQITVDSPEIREALAARLNDPQADTRAEAVLGLARRKDTRVVNSLLEALSSASVDDLAIEAAEELADTRLCSALEELRERWPEERKSQLQYLDDAIVACNAGRRRD